MIFDENRLLRFKKDKIPGIGENYTASQFTMWFLHSIVLNSVQKEMSGWLCSTHKDVKMFIQNVIWKKGKKSRDSPVQSIILNWIEKKQDVRVWILDLRAQEYTGFWSVLNALIKPSCFTKCRAFLSIWASVNFSRTSLHGLSCTYTHRGGKHSYHKR